MKLNLLVFQKVFRKIGSYVFNFFYDIGDVFFFFLLFIKNLLTDKFYFRLFFNQIVKIGFNSLPVVGLTAIFTGMVLALQSYTGFSRFSAESAIPNVVVLSITRELAPVLAGLMVAGRAGAAIAAEIGTMKVTTNKGYDKTKDCCFYKSRKYINKFHKIISIL